MKILLAKYVLVCDTEFSILRNQAVVFDDKIIKITDIANLDKLKCEFSDFEIYDFSNDVLMPALINSHVHLEYSANIANLAYGDFMIWLKSVIKNRENLSAENKKIIMQNALESMVKSGVGTIGEISSFGADLDLDFKVRTFLFNEILGSSEANSDANFANFKARFDRSTSQANELFIPAISVHSPYSTHPKLATKALNLARELNLIASAHFMESKHEKIWLEQGVGEFASWLKNFSPNPKPMYNPSSFLAMFESIKTLFTHCVFASDYLSEFDSNLHSITHCPRSNRLLSKAKLNLNSLGKIAVNIGTDGLSSNYSLNIWDELRAALFMHVDIDLISLARILLLASTKNAAFSLGLNSGEIKENKIADIAVFKGLGELSDEQIALQMILHKNEAKKLFVSGREII